MANTILQPRDHEVNALDLGLANFGFVTGMLAVVGLPLLGSRISPAMHSAWAWVPAMVAFLCVFVLWGRTCRFPQIHAPTEWSRFELSIASITLIMCSALIFFLPQSSHFWGGYDDYSAYDPLLATYWSSETFDKLQGRPLLGLSYFLGNLVGAGRIEGFLALALILNLANAAAIWATIRISFPNSSAIALSAAVLLIANRSDPLKFYPLWAANPYGLGVFCFLLAMVTFVYSWQRQSRAVLVLSCVSLGCSLLMYEVGYLLSGIPLLLVWLDRQRSNTNRLWLFAWIGTVSLMASRLILFFALNRNSYQLTQATQSGASLGQLLKNFEKHVAGFLTYFKLPEVPWAQWEVSLLVFVIAFTGILLVGRRGGFPKFSKLQWAVMFSCLGIGLAVFPYSHLAGNERTQFFSMPFQATLLAMVLATTTCIFPHNVRVCLLACGVGLFAASSTAQSLTQQRSDHSVSYQKVVHVCDQIRGICSTLTEDDLVVLVHRGNSPFGADYAAFYAGPYWVGSRIAQVGDTANPHIALKFDTEKVSLLYSGSLFKNYDAERLLVFQLEPDGTLFFQSHWPQDERLTPVCSSYEPLAHLSPSKIKRRPDFNYPIWSDAPNDVVNQRDGELLGAGWSPLKFENGWLVRELKPGAEIIVNGQGEKEHALTIDVEPLDSDRSTPIRLELIDSTLRPVAQMEFKERTKFDLRLPSAPGRISAYTVRCPDFAPDSNGAAIARVFVKRGPFAEDPLRTPVDIVRGGVTLGTGWYAPEMVENKPLRWLDTDGEIITGACELDAEPTLGLELNPGPGLDGKPCKVELRSSSDILLGVATLTFKDRIAFKLPRNFPSGERLKLRVLDGGKLIPGDSRVLNVQVTECNWRSH